VSPLVFYVTDRKSLPGGTSAELLESVRRAAISNVDFVQIREKDLPTGELLRIVRDAVRVTREISSTRIIVNDRLDVALAAGASGVHLGRESLPAKEAIQWCRAGNAPANFMVGVSCHTIEEAREAERAGANCAFFGPVFDTPSKRSLGPPQGIELLRRVCCTVKMPVIAIGGVNDSTAAECIKAGAAGIAAIRMIQEATDLKALAAAIRLIHHLPHV
jgi:thiamine-phosphate diphosphorylase